jgi:hypothetical protein
LIKLDHLLRQLNSLLNTDKEMKTESSGKTSLLYFPKSSFSSRFGDTFFTVAIKTFVTRKASKFLCYIGNVIFYEIEVKRGKAVWKVYRRYAEFAALYNNLEKDDLPSTVDAPLSFPPKTLMNNLIDDPQFLKSRSENLEIALDKILTAASQKSVVITYSIAVTAFLELDEDHRREK